MKKQKSILGSMISGHTSNKGLDPEASLDPMDMNELKNQIKN
jgi:hypothetical protein